MQEGLPLMFSSGLINNPISPAVRLFRINHTSSTLGSEYIVADKANKLC